MVHSQCTNFYYINAYNNGKIMYSKYIGKKNYEIKHYQGPKFFQKPNTGIFELLTRNTHKYEYSNTNNPPWSHPD